MKKITSLKQLPLGEQFRMGKLKEIFKEEGRIPLGTSLQEVRYLLRLKKGRRRYHQRKSLPTEAEQREWRERMKTAFPGEEESVEEILASLSSLSTLPKPPLSPPTFDPPPNHFSPLLSPPPPEKDEGLSEGGIEDSPGGMVEKREDGMEEILKSLSATLQQNREEEEKSLLFIKATNREETH